MSGDPDDRLIALRFAAHHEGEPHSGMVKAATELFASIAKQAGVEEACRIFEVVVAKHAAERTPRGGRPAAIGPAKVEVLLHLYDQLAPEFRRYAQGRGNLNFRDACREITKDEAAGGLSTLTIEGLLRAALRERERKSKAE